jgi:non-ribosomal peptide synthetase component E (peptide arylation enzyme)
MDGDREYLQQIKEKVASILLQNLLIDDCAVLVSEIENSPLSLVVYIISSQPPLLEQLRFYLHDVIPDSLLPKKYVLVPKLPRNAVGQVDEQALANVPQKIYRHSVTLAFSDGGCLPEVADAPTTLIELLHRAQKSKGEIIYLESGEEIHQSYAQLLIQAQRVLSGLRQLKKLQVGDKVILQLENNCDIIPAFWGCVLGGFIPVIMEVPPTYTDRPALDKLRHTWEFLAKPLIITSEKSAAIAELLQKVKAKYISSLNFLTKLVLNILCYG